MKVYHGSDIRIDAIDLTKCKPRKDFGQGFYVTNIYHQAADMANRIADWHHTLPIITEFDFDEFAYADDELHILRFENYTEKWFDFVILNRNNRLRTQAHTFDIVEGPVADDAVTLRINDYLKGNLSKQAFLEELKFYKQTHQICFCTDKSLLMLKRATDEIGNTIYHIDDNIIQQLMIDYELSDTQASDLYFDSATYARLIDESTGIYKKPWRDIYKFILLELKMKR